MADRRLNQKTTREEDKQESPSKALTSLHSENQEDQDQDSSVPISRIHPLRLREMGKNAKLPHIYRDYHVHTFNSQVLDDMGTINFIVPGDDMILVVHSHSKVDLFTRDGDQILALEDDDGKHLTYAVEGSIKSVCYNNHDNSFLIEYMLLEQEILGLEINIVALQLASIEEGRSSEMMKLVFPGESKIVKWDFDIPMCRGMIHNCKDRKFKFCELKEYSLLFTIPDFGSTQVGSAGTPCPYFESLCPGNMDMVMYDTVSSSLNGIHLRIYSKLTGVLQKEIFLPQPEPSNQQHIEFIAPCGSDTLLVQRHLLEIEVVEMSSERPVSIIKRRNTKIRAACDPYYLHKRSHFICYTESKAIHVCNLQGEILVTLEDHPLHGPNLKHMSFFVHSYISSSQDILISLCCRQWMYSVNVSSIVTGECLAKISSADPNCSEIRKAALNPPVVAFAYDGKTHEIFTGTDNGVCGVWSNKFYNDVGDVNLDESEE